MVTKLCWADVVTKLRRRRTRRSELRRKEKLGNALNITTLDQIRQSWQTQRRRKESEEIELGRRGGERQVEAR